MFNFGDLDIAGWIVPVAAISGWVFITLFRLYVVGRTREQAHRERMAMIERGLVPPPADDKHLDATMDLHPGSVPGQRRGPGSQRAGIILIAVGVGLAAMLFVTGNGGRSMGASAFLIVLGLAFLLIAMLEGRSSHDEQPRTPGSPTGA